MAARLSHPSRAGTQVGCVHGKNINNIILKGTIDTCIAAIFFWAVGFGVAFGGGEPGSLVGGRGYFFGSCLHKLGQGSAGDCEGLTMASHEWFFQFAFAATASTIVSGAVAERTTVSCYAIYSALITARMRGGAGPARVEQSTKQLDGKSSWTEGALRPLEHCFLSRLLIDEQR